MPLTFLFKTVPITRRSSSVSTVNRVTGDSDIFQIFTFPFAQFPTLTSHIHPRFAIVQAGYMFKLVNDSLPRTALLKHAMAAGRLDHIRAVVKIYEAWTYAAPNEADDRESFRAHSDDEGGNDDLSDDPYDGNDNNDDDDDDEDDDDDDDEDEDGGGKKDNRHLEATRTESRRTRSETQRKQKGGSPTPKRKRCRTGNLRTRHLQLHTVKVGKRKWEGDLISEWAQQCYPYKLQLDRDGASAGMSGERTLV